MRPARCSFGAARSSFAGRRSDFISLSAPLWRTAFLLSEVRGHSTAGEVVAGYSRLMALDEQATLVRLEEARTAFRFHIESRQDRMVDMAGGSVDS